MVPLLVFGLCGAIGLAVDVFDGIAILTYGPRGLYHLDLVVAVAFTVIIGGLDAFARRFS